MATLDPGEIAIAHLRHSSSLVPVVEHQLQFWLLHRGSSKAGLCVNFCEGGLDRGDVASVSVQKEEVCEAMLGQTFHIVFNDRNQRGGADGDGAGKAQVMLSHT